METATTLELSTIRAEAGVQIRTKLDVQRIQLFASLYAEGRHVEPVVVYRVEGDYVLADGFHRLAGAQAAKVETISAYVRNGTMDDALAFAAVANARHGRPLTQSEATLACTRLIGLQWTVPHIADELGRSRQWVYDVQIANKVRAKISPSLRDKDIPLTALIAVGKSGLAARHWDGLIKVAHESGWTGAQLNKAIVLLKSAPESLEQIADAAREHQLVQPDDDGFTPVTTAKRGSGVTLSLQAWLAEAKILIGVIPAEAVRAISPNKLQDIAATITDVTTWLEEVISALAERETTTTS